MWKFVCRRHTSLGSRNSCLIQNESVKEAFSERMFIFSQIIALLTTSLVTATILMRCILGWLEIWDENLVAKVFQFRISRKLLLTTFFERVQRCQIVNKIQSFLTFSIFPTSAFESIFMRYVKLFDIQRFPFQCEIKWIRGRLRLNLTIFVLVLDISIFQYLNENWLISINKTFGREPLNLNWSTPDLGFRS